VNDGAGQRVVVLSSVGCRGSRVVGRFGATIQSGVVQLPYGVRLLRLFFCRLPFLVLRVVVLRRVVLLRGVAACFTAYAERLRELLQPLP
jgi:hypothetical protein